VQLGGLPESGYTPGESYRITLAWPEFAERARELREAMEEPASMSLVAELVAESGEGAGTVQIVAAADADADELCAFPEGAAAAILYRLPPGEPPREAGTRCTSDALGERCVVAVLSCGAERLQLTWTAPEVDQGTVWFAAGFVAAEQVSGDPSGDAVTELLVPLASPKSPGGARASVLQSECAVARPGQAAGTHAAPFGLAGLALLVALRRRRGGRR
jgi:MYXO-CTERM domain-containing protein